MIDTSLLAILSTWLPLEEASYYAYPKGDKPKLSEPVLPTGWKLVTTIQPNNFGYIATELYGPVSVVAFRGTERLKEWAEDLNFLEAPCYLGTEWGTVHKGMQEAFMPLLPCLTETVTLNENSQVVLLGHSLGGSLAVLAAAYFAKFKPAVVTYEMPRVAHHQFAEVFNSQIKNCVRVEDHLDPIPSFPSEPIYTHVGDVLRIDGGWALDIEELHSLDRCQRGLQRLLGKGA